MLVSLRTLAQSVVTPVWVAEGLLGDALDVLLVTQLCRIVTLMTDGAKLPAPAFDALVGMIDDLIHCTGSERASARPRMAGRRSSVAGMNAWPPKPGLTDIQSSTSA